MNQGFANSKVPADELQAIMDDYNAMFGTAFTTDNFSAYYDDVNERMKNAGRICSRLICCWSSVCSLPVLMPRNSTRFMSTKSGVPRTAAGLQPHEPCTEREKRFGKIVCFRDLKANVDAAIKLFSNNEPNEYIIREPFEKVRKELNLKMISFLEKYPNVSYIDALKSEPEKRAFILAFREIIRGKIEAQVYEEYEADDPYFIMSEQEYMDFRSKYLDIAIGHTGNEEKETPGATPADSEPERIDDVDFCLELLHSDVINVAYILELIADLNPDSEDYQQKRQLIIDTMIRDASMRNKAKLIDGFIQQNVDDDKAGFNRAKADGSIDLETRLTNYVSAARERAIEQLSEEEGLSLNALKEYLSQYDYLQREKPEIIQNAIKEKRVGLKERRNILKRVLGKLRIIIDMFNWE